MAGDDLTIEVTRWSAQVEVLVDEDGGGGVATVTAELDLGSRGPRGDGRGQAAQRRGPRPDEEAKGGDPGRGHPDLRLVADHFSGASGSAIEGMLTGKG